MGEHIGGRRLRAAEGSRFYVDLLRAAGLAVVLGLIMEALLVVGGQEPANLTSLLDNGLWPLLVCMTLAVGQAISSANPSTAGTFSLLITPLAFLVAKIAPKGVRDLLAGVSLGNYLSADLLLEAGLRAIEYAVLAAVLAYFWRQQGAGILMHLGLGLGIGVLFGLFIAAFVSPPSFLNWVEAEVVFPTGCALIVYVSQTPTQLLPDDDMLT